ncbi:MAG: hypothetical protein ABW116_01530 [Candidatus Sedimenticola sp. 20ELBAFRAG]
MVKNIFVIMLMAFISMGCEAETSGSTDKLSASGFTFTDERCKNARESGVVCAAKSQSVPVSDLIGNKVDFKTFIQLNREVLPNDVSRDTVLPARTFYITRVN